MTNIEQFTRELMLAHDIDYKTALSRAEQFYDMLDTDRPEVLSGWISVEDKLPEHMQPILVYGKKIQVTSAYFHPNCSKKWTGWFSNQAEDPEITHWQPRPNEPLGF